MDGEMRIWSFNSDHVNNVYGSYHMRYTHDTYLSILYVYKIHFLLKIKIVKAHLWIFYFFFRESLVIFERLK